MVTFTGPSRLNKKKKKDEEEKKEEPTPQPKPEPVSIPQVPSGVQPAQDVAFFKDPKTGETQFAGPGAEAERQFLGQPTTAVEEELLGREKVARQFLEERGFFDETIPKIQELDIERKGFIESPGSLERLAILGPGAKGGARAITDFLGIAEKELPLIQDPQTAREFALQQIQIEVIKEGASGSETFGALIEAIPIAGPFVGKYAGALIEDPKSNVDTLLAEIDSERERSATLAEKIMTGKSGDPFEAFIQIEDIEANLFRLEQRIHILSQQSAVLIADADQINKIEERILRAKERVFQAKQAAAGGLIAPASDTNIFLTLKRLQDENK